MTRTQTSKAPGSGISISSIWNASTGSPSRSWRMTQAAIVAGISPGSVSTVAMRSMSTAIGPGTLLTHPGPAEPDDEGGDRDEFDRKAEDQEVPEGVDVPHQPAEVLAEEPGQEGQRQEDRADHGQPRDPLIQPIGLGREIDVEHAGELVPEGLDAVGDPQQVVVDVAEVVVRAFFVEAGELLEEAARRGEDVALGGDAPAELAELALQRDDLVQALRIVALDDHVLEAVDLVVDALDEREERVSQGVQDPVDRVL